MKPDLNYWKELIAKHHPHLDEAGIAVLAQEFCKSHPDYRRRIPKWVKNQTVLLWVLIFLLMGILLTTALKAQDQLFFIANNGTRSYTVAAPFTLNFGSNLTVTTSGNIVTVTGTAPAGVPSGMIAFISTGACPSGWTENDSLTGYNVLVTSTANGDVGASGVSTLIASAQTFTGSTTTVPAETVNSLTAAAQTFTGSSTTVPAETVNSLTAAAQVFTGTANQTTSGTSAGTPAGTNSGGSFSEGAISWPVGVPTNASGAFSQGAISWPGGVPTFAGSAGTVPAETFTGTTNQTTSGTSAGTPAGTNSTVSWTIVTSGYSTGTTKYSPSSFGGSALASGTTSITVPAETFTGSAMATHTHTLTPAGTNSTASFTPSGTIAWPAGVPSIASGTFTQPTISWPAGVPTIGAGTFTQPTFAGSALGTHTHTLTPSGTNASSSVTGTLNSTTITPLGSNATSAVTGTLNSTTITPLGTNASSAVTGVPAFYKVIACQKN